MEVEQLFQRVADSALSIVILVSWVLSLMKRNNMLIERIDRCMSRFEKHLETHEKID